MNATTSPVDPAIVRSLTEGDVITVTFGRDGKTRTVRVLEVVETDITFGVYTTSGRCTHASHRPGGALTLWKRDGAITFQPTIRQNAETAVSVTRLGTAN